MRWESLKIAVIAAAFLAMHSLITSTTTSGDERRSAVVARRPTVEFTRDVLPILRNRCFECHGPETQEGKLRLDARRAVLDGGVSGPVIHAGDSDRSLLVRRLLGLDELDRMPLDAEPLTSGEIHIIRTWIDSGAEWPDGIGAHLPAADTHWAYRKPVRPQLPPVDRREWIRNAIDAFVLARLEERGIEPAAESSKETLIRRVTLDLTGLPPTLDEIDSFLADLAPDAYQKVVDRLLASPRYGERWAVPWLDAARYADSNGYQRDGQRDAWPYRDWVIDALNADMPFDRFTIEQIGGDLFSGATSSQIVATGFHRGTMANVEAGTDPEEEYTLAVIDRVNTTATVWLGTTIECAQCHSHKYDPFSQREYYQLYAFFNSTAKEIETFPDESRREFTGPTMTLPPWHEWQTERQQLQPKLEAAAGAVTAREQELTEQQTAWEAKLDSSKMDALPEAVREAILLSPDKRTKRQSQKVRNYMLSSDPQLRKLREAHVELQERWNRLTKTTTLVMQELPTPRETRIFKRGDFLNPGAKVVPGTPRVLHPMRSQSPRDRRGLGEWLVDRDNPLVARVTVNRNWLEFFGQGLVSTPEDFGAQGERPTHPDLLDWLSVEFMQQGWSLKGLHRLIVTSATYRQRSESRPELRRLDPKNQLYGRGPRFRLNAEFVRDNALAASGLLSGKLYGPPVFPVQPPGVWNHIGRASNDWITSKGEDLFRRGLYTYWRRTVPYPSLVNFDAPSREACVVQRSRSNTPLQALTLLNDPAFFEAAIALVARSFTEQPSDATPEERAGFLFRLTTGRRPTQSETRILVSRIETERVRYQENPDLVQQLLAGWPVPDTVDPVQFAPWVHVGNVLMNLDEVITKN